MNKEFRLKTGSGELFCRCWEPEGQPRAVVQLVHGIAEHSLRYDNYARWLTQRGILVVADDHMGHGRSIGSEDIRGYFRGGWDAAVEDSYALLRHTMDLYPDVPYILFGHSMGSFMVRTILAKYPDSGVAGCVICGTTWQNQAFLKTELSTAKFMCLGGGDKRPCVAIQKMMQGTFNRRVEHRRKPNDWLSRDNRSVDAYEADPLCGFAATAGLYRDLFGAMLYLQKPETLANMNKKLPILFTAGGDDAMGDYGKGVDLAAREFRQAGMECVKLKLYPLCRHEILNELNREEVYRDILAWMEQCLAPGL